MKLALGTVQFGLKYGAFNASGQIDGVEAQAIIEVAQAAGIDTIDTARAYGTSEMVLGSLDVAKNFRVVTKIASLAQDVDKAASVSASLSKSQDALQSRHLDVALFHSADDLLGPFGAICWDAADCARQDGQVGALGVSVYNAADALAVAERFPIKVVQLPVSVFDQRAVLNGDLERLKAKGIEVHARSIFLQGFAFAKPDALPAGLFRFRSELEAFIAYADQLGASRLQAALGFVLAQATIDRVIIGVQAAQELKDICAEVGHHFDQAGAALVASSDLRLLNPGLWPGDGA